MTIAPTEQVAAAHGRTSASKPPDTSADVDPMTRRAVDSLPIRIGVLGLVVLVVFVLITRRNR